MRGEPEYAEVFVREDEYSPGSYRIFAFRSAGGRSAELHRDSDGHLTWEEVPLGGVSQAFAQVPREIAPAFFRAVAAYAGWARMLADDGYERLVRAKDDHIADLRVAAGITRRAGREKDHGEA